MFSASLVTAMIHGFWLESWSGLGSPEDPLRGTLAADLARGIASLQRKSEVHLPIVARAKGPSIDAARELENIDTGEVHDDPFTYLWGRVPLDQLVGSLEREGGPLEDRAVSLEYGDRQLFDLASTFLTAAAPVGFDADAVCQKLVPLTVDPASSSVTIGFVDRGVESPGMSAETFGGNLHQVNGRDVTMSPHAKAVLAVMLETCVRLGIMQHVHFACALARPAPRLLRTGLGCLEQDNAAEILTAAKGLSRYLSGKGPASLNLSMGTHIGPHDGQSPLESFVSGFTNSYGPTFMHVAGGNHGEAGYHAEIPLQARDPDALILNTGPQGSSELLVEFWWEDLDPAGFVDVDVEVFDQAGVPRFTTKMHLHAPSGNLAGTFALAPPRHAHDARQSLTAIRCLNDMSCIAFGISGQPATLANLRIRFDLVSSTDRILHAWVVGSTDPDTNFVTATREETLMVPATARDVVAVAGVEGPHRLWLPSSRGPAASYRAGIPGERTPHVAHAANAGTEWGSSFASARTCAETAARLLDPGVRARCTDRDALVRELLRVAALGQWSPRVGYGSVL